nr:hypothetical protein [Tanacetum cinerariifolium]
MRRIELDADEDVTLVDVDTVVEMDANTQGRMEEDVNAIKEVNATEPTVFDDKEQAAARERQEKEDLEKAKVLQQQYDQKKENIDWNVVVEQMQEKHLDNIKKYQSLKRKPIFIAHARKNMIVYLKNMAGYKIQHFKEKDYPLSNQVMNLMMGSRLQVKKDTEVARDLVMKIFLKANQPKSKSLDTSSN